MDHARPKRWIFTGVTIGIVYIAIELIAILGHAVTQGSGYSKTAVRHAMRDAASSVAPRAAAVEDVEPDREAYHETIHPFFGYVVDPYRSGSRYAVSSMGFSHAAEDRPLAPPEQDVVRIAVFGGSVAAGFAFHARNRMPACLGSQGQQIEILNFANGGYKQPQQLHILTDLYARGARFDIVINLDGFNELALSVSENVAAGVLPHFPRRWHERVSNVVSPEKTKLLAELAIAEAQRARWAERLLELKLYRSPAVSLLWRVASDRAESGLFDLRNRIREIDDLSDQEQIYSIRDGRGSMAEAYREVSQTWARSSRQMHALTEFNGGRYFHFLQPNQYHIDSKPMSDAEKSIAFIEHHPYRRPIEQGYPLLIAEGARLAAEGVLFHDLTGMFEEIVAPMYRDACCHLNLVGAEMMIEEICGIVRGRLSRTAHEISTPPRR